MELVFAGRAGRGAGCLKVTAEFGTAFWCQIQFPARQKKKLKNKVIFCMGTGERNFPGVAAKGREWLVFHVQRKTSQSLLCLISCVEFCREIPSRSGDDLHVTRRRFSQTAWWKFPLPSAAGWQPRCTSIQLCRNTERVAVYSLFIRSHSKHGLESFRCYVLKLHN